jgi:osmotically-inducible protein OsmY
LRKRAAEYVSRIAKVRHVYNEIEIRAPLSAVQVSTDGLTTTKVKSKLLTIRDLKSSSVKVVTENGVVYLMGLLDQATGDAVAEVVAGVSGVQKVVKLFEAPAR